MINFGDRETDLATGLDSEVVIWTLNMKEQRSEHTSRGGAGDCHDRSAENESVVLRVEMSHLIPIPYFRRNVGIDQSTLHASPKCGFVRVRYLHVKKRCDRKIIFPRRQISNNTMMCRHEIPVITLRRY